MPTNADRPARGGTRAAPVRRTSPHPRATLALTIQIGERSPALPVDRPQLRRWAQAALARPAELVLRFVSHAEGRELNRAFRGRDYATNVLTFPYDDPDEADDAPVRADIVICLPVLAREARAQRKTLRDHLAHLVVHGVLHAQGWDHLDDAQAQAMEACERRLLARFRIADPYRDGASPG